MPIFLDFQLSIQLRAVIEWHFQLVLNTQMHRVVCVSKVNRFWTSFRKFFTTFAAKPRDYSKKVNKKMYRGAMQAILSELVRQERLVVATDFKVEAAKTKEMVAKLKELERRLYAIDARTRGPAADDGENKYQ